MKLRQSLIVLLILVPAITALFPLYNRLMSGLFYLRGNNLVLEDSYGLAAEKLKRADYYSSDNFMIKQKLGQIYFNMGELRERAPESLPLTLKSKDYYMASFAINPLEAETAFGLARTDWKLEELHSLLYPNSGENPYQPLEWFEKALELRPNSIQYRYVMLRYLSKKDPSVIGPIVATLVRIYPTSYSYLKKEPFWDDRIKEYARQGLDKAVSLGITPRIAHRALSDFYALKGDWLDAINHYENSMNYRTFENSAADHINLGNLFLKNNDPDMAGQHFLKAITGSGSRESDMKRIYNLYKAAGYPSEFSTFYVLIRDRFITSIGMDILYAMNLFDLEEYNSAQEALLDVIKDDKVPEAYYWLARIAEKEKDWDSMELAIQKATVLDPDNSQYHRIFAQVLNRLNKLERAEKEAGLAIEYSDSPSASAFHFRASIRWNQKDYTGAAMDWQRAIRLKPENASFCAQAAEAHYRAGNLELALRYYKRAVSLDPDKDSYKKRLEEITSLQAQNY